MRGAPVRAVLAAVLGGGSAIAHPHDADTGYCAKGCYGTAPCPDTYAAALPDGLWTRLAVPSTSGTAEQLQPASLPRLSTDRPNLITVLQVLTGMARAVRALDLPWSAMNRLVRRLHPAGDLCPLPVLENPTTTATINSGCRAQPNPKIFTTNPPVFLFYIPPHSPGDQEKNMRLLPVAVLWHVCITHIVCFIGF